MSNKYDFECHVTVDAQNSFGAVIRSKYIVTMTYLGSDRWTLKDLKKGY